MIRSILLLIAVASGGGALLLMMQGPVTSSPEADRTTAGAVAGEAAPGAVAAPAPEAPVTTEVLALTGDIATGEPALPEDFAWIDWPEDFVITGFILREDEPDAIRALLGKVAVRDLSGGEPVLARAFEAPQAAPDTAPLAAAMRQVGEGMRPVSLPVELARPLGSIIAPGDRVDLVHVHFPDTADVPVSRILVPDARVLSLEPALEGGTTRTPGALAASRHDAVLALSFGDAAEALAAAQVGSLSLLLRSPDDRMVPPTPPEVAAAPVAPEAQEAPAPPAAPPRRDIAADIAAGKRGFVLSGGGLPAADQLRHGDRVDVIFTPAPADALWPESRALVTNARVIGPPVETGAASPPAPSGGAGTVTLELDPPGVEAVTTALERGRVSISLRPEQDPDARYAVMPLPPPPVEVRVRRAGAL